ncbi:MAG: hypothetical protein AMJ65_09415 [Phycisphaerae bacterium SG8_4]|nr:MAG: hypothetical protein AMJ65_09415 [Phycisphaerae bacterium SG8_4]
MVLLAGIYYPEGYSMNEERANLVSTSDTHYSMGMAENTEQNWVEQAKHGEPAATAQLCRHCWRAARAAAQA